MIVVFLVFILSFIVGEVAGGIAQSRVDAACAAKCDELKAKVIDEQCYRKGKDSWNFARD